ncbi:MAG: TIGR01459 family HAD-type hydrolase [Pseudomonadota bacterium]
MTALIQSLSDVSDRFEAVFCDLWGCLHNGREAFPEAVAALTAYRRRGGTVVLLTNAPRPASAVSAQLDRLGVPRESWDAIATSGEAAQEAMLRGAVGRRVWHLGPAKDDAFFTEIPEELRSLPPVERVAFDEAEGIVCTGPFDDLTETPDDYVATFLAAKARGLKMLCANPDIVVDLGETRIWCAGGLAERYQEMGGEALYYGKPHPPVYDLARRKLAALTGRETEPGAILAIGDGIGTDIAGGIAEGLETLFVTCGLAAEEFGPRCDQPDPERLNAWLSHMQLSPTFAIGRLR